jgi:hypothetical protein
LSRACHLHLKLTSPRRLLSRWNNVLFCLRLQS